MEAADMLVGVGGLNRVAYPQLDQSELHRVYEFSRATMMTKATAIMHSGFAWLAVLAADIGFFSRLMLQLA